MDANNNNDETWRSALPPDARQKIVIRIMDYLQRCMPPTTGQERLEKSMGELLKLALRFEEKVFVIATDQEDYLRKISSKLLKVLSYSPAAPSQAAPVPGTQGRLGDPAGLIQSVDPGAAMLTHNQQNLSIGVQLPGAVFGQPGTTSGTTETTADISISSE